MQENDLIDEQSRTARIEELLARLLLIADRGEPLDFENVARQHDELQPELDKELSKLRRILSARDSANRISLHSNSFGRNPTIDISGNQHAAFTFKHGDKPLNGYTIERGIGFGGFGEVYYALSDHGRKVALKYLRDHPQIELRGAKECQNLKSPYLVTIFNIEENDRGQWFVIMEYIDGPTLRDVIDSSAVFGEPDPLHATRQQASAFFVREIAKGLTYLHDRGIVHRDLKPGNIFFDEGFVKIGDYGLSKAAASTHSTHSAVGTVHYMAPEVGTGYYSQSVDIYSLGIILYEMLMGKVPFDGESHVEVLAKHLSVEPLLDTVPAPFAAVIRRALAKDKAARYQRVSDMVADLFGNDELEYSASSFEPTSLSIVVHRAAQLHLAGNPHPRKPLPASVNIDAHCNAIETRERIAEDEAIANRKSSLCALMDRQRWADAKSACAVLLALRPNDPELIKARDFIAPRYALTKQQVAVSQRAAVRARWIAAVRALTPCALISMTATSIAGMVFGYGAGSGWCADSNEWIWCSSPVTRSIERASLPALTILAIVGGIIPIWYGWSKVRKSRSQRGFFDRLFNFSANFDEWFQLMAWSMGGLASGFGALLISKVFVIAMAAPVAFVTSDLSPVLGTMYVGTSGALIGLLIGALVGAVVHVASKRSEWQGIKT